MRSLFVILDRSVVGELIQTDGGEHRFSYVGARTAPISLSMPVDGGQFRHRVVDPFLEGLLPDQASVREALAARYGVSPRNPFALLEHIGLDCAGAVRFADAEHLTRALDDDGELVALSEEEIGARLAALEEGREPSWIAPGEGWSLAGSRFRPGWRRSAGRAPPPGPMVTRRVSRSGARPWDDPGVSSPLLSVVVPAYNSADFLLACLETLVVPGGEVEVVVVDDGSSDATGEVAEGFASAHEGFRVIRQENKGHGGAVNTGVAAATGTWIKVVDSDDALDPVALARVLTQLREWRDQGVEPDLVVTNFVYMRADRRPHRHAVRYPRILPQGRVGSWSDVGRFRPDQYLMMHALMYRTEVLRDSGMRLPEHCFYVDNLYSFEPLIHVDSLVYINEDLYLYTIGREGQSVSDEVIVTRLDQHDRVNALMLEAMPRTGEVGPELEAYLIHIYLMSCVVITTMALRSNTPANLAIKDRLWARMEKQRPDVYTKLRRKTLGRVLHLPGRAGRTVPVLGYHVARRVLALN